jgi:CheY-like chemotaxis protein
MRTLPKILLIDDDDLVRYAMVRILARDEYQIVCASNGREGVAALEKEPFDLVITDILMPDQEGIETIRAIRRLSPAVPIIAISGGGRFSGADYLAIAEKFGASKTLPKPFEPATLLSSVQQCLTAGA